MSGTEQAQQDQNEISEAALLCLRRSQPGEPGTYQVIADKLSALTTHIEALQTPQALLTAVEELVNFGYYLQLERDSAAAAEAIFAAANTVAAPLRVAHQNDPSEVGRAFAQFSGGPQSSESEPLPVGDDARTSGAMLRWELAEWKKDHEPEK